MSATSHMSEELGMPVIAWLQTIPATSFVGMLAFIGTILTVIWTNKATSSRLQRQLVDDRQREEATRLFESRRDVFLEAAEAITVAMTCIGRLADLNRATADILKPYEDQVGKIARVHLVAGPDVGAHVVAIGSEIGRAVVELTVGRVPLEISRSHVKALEGRAGDDPDATAHVAELWRDLLARQIEFAERCAGTSKRLAPIIGAAILAIRTDLHMPPYVPDFSKLLSDTAGRQIDHLKDSFSSLLGDLKTPPRIESGPPGTITR